MRPQPLEQQNTNIANTAAVWTGEEEGRAHMGGSELQVYRLNMWVWVCGRGHEAITDPQPHYLRACTP